MDIDCTQECEVVKELKAKIKSLERQPHLDECPNCKAGMIKLTTKQLKVCDCGYQEPFKLKPGQRSLLIKNFIGGREG